MALRTNRMYMAIGILVLYVTFIEGIFAGIITPYLGGLTSGIGIFGTLILNGILVGLPAYFIIKDIAKAW